MDPARSIVLRLGNQCVRDGVERVAEITGRDTTSVYRWMRSADKGGTDGEIPTRAAKRLREYARLHGIEFPTACDSVA